MVGTAGASLWPSIQVTYRIHATRFSPLFARRLQRQDQEDSLSPLLSPLPLPADLKQIFITYLMSNLSLGMVRVCQDMVYGRSGFNSLQAVFPGVFCKIINLEREFLWNLVT